MWSIEAAEVRRLLIHAKPKDNPLSRVEVEREEDGRWIAEVVEVPGVLAYGNSPTDAVERAKALAERVLADRLKSGENTPDSGSV
jgi:predicted RNase H-like HicB family nuclease